MTTWRLWRALNNPPTAHPLYQHAAAFTPLLFPRRYIAGWVVFVYLIFCCGTSFLWPVAVRWLPVLVAAVIVLGNTTYSLTWAVQFSSVIARERENNTYDLLCVSPPGPLAVSWALCTARLHHTQLFTWVYFGVRFVALVVIVTLSVVLVIPLLSLLHSTDQSIHLGLFHTLVNILALSVGFLVDHIQSFVLGSLAGMVAPVFARHSSESRFRAMATFLELQLSGYFLAGVLGLLCVPAVFSLLHISGWFATAGQAIMALAVFIAIRESFMFGFWRYVTGQLNASMAEFDLASYQAK